MNVSVHTVRRVVNETANSLRIKPLNELSEHMCWDEFKSIASAEASISFAYCDAITHQLIDIVQDRKMENLVCYFNQFPLETRLNVKTISIDMYDPYIEVIKRLFPKAKIINEFKEGLLTVNSKQLSDGLNRVLQTFKKLLPYIQNTCEYPTLSNGPIEGINNKIKVLKRNAYGYSSFTHFRNRILLMSKLFTPTTKKGIKQPDAA